MPNATEGFVTTEKAGKVDVAYRKADRLSLSCGTCKYFLRGHNACRIVEGEIHAGDVCRLWVRQTDAQTRQYAAQSRTNEYAEFFRRQLSMPQKYAQPSDTADVSPEKARKILADGEIHGKPLTDKQRGFFGAIAGK